MEQYIPKSALLVEIEKLKGKVDDGSSYYNGWQHALRMLELSLNTLEVKEVNLEKEINDWYNTMGIPVTTYALKETARHFFELGLKAQYSSIDIPNIDDILEEEGIDPNSKDAKIFKECYYMALEKLEAQKGE